MPSHQSLIFKCLLEKVLETNTSVCYCFFLVLLMQQIIFFPHHVYLHILSTTEAYDTERTATTWSTKTTKTLNS